MGLILFSAAIVICQQYEIGYHCKDNTVQIDKSRPWWSRWRRRAQTQWPASADLTPTPTQQRRSWSWSRLRRFWDGIQNIWTHNQVNSKYQKNGVSTVLGKIDLIPNKCKYLFFIFYKSAHVTADKCLRMSILCRSGTAILTSTEIHSIMRDKV